MPDDDAGRGAGRTIMWEARAADGRGDELLAWVLAAAPASAPAYRAGDRVVVLLPAGADVVLGDPPEELLARPIHRWPFDRVR